METFCLCLHYNQLYDTLVSLKEILDHMTSIAHNNTYPIDDAPDLLGPEVGLRSYMGGRLVAGAASAADDERGLTPWELEANGFAPPESPSETLSDPQEASAQPDSAEAGDATQESDLHKNSRSFLRKLLDVETVPEDLTPMKLEGFMDLVGLLYVQNIPVDERSQRRNITTALYRMTILRMHVRGATDKEMIQATPVAYQGMIRGVPRAVSKTLHKQGFSPERLRDLLGRYLAGDAIDYSHEQSELEAVLVEPAAPEAIDLESPKRLVPSKPDPALTKEVLAAGMIASAHKLLGNILKDYDDKALRLLAGHLVGMNNLGPEVFDAGAKLRRKLESAQASSVTNTRVGHDPKAKHVIHKKELVLMQSLLPSFGEDQLQPTTLRAVFRAEQDREPQSDLTFEMLQKVVLRILRKIDKAKK
jgi:hypothetical protein